MAITLNSSKFKIKIDKKEYADCIYFANSQIDIKPQYREDDDGRKGAETKAGNVSFSTVVIRRPFTVGDSTLMDWIQNTRKQGAEKNKKTVGITVFDEAESGKLEYALSGTWPTSYSHSPLRKGEGASPVIEEITLIVEDVEYKALN